MRNVQTLLFCQSYFTYSWNMLTTACTVEPVPRPGSSVVSNTLGSSRCTDHSIKGREAAANGWPARLLHKFSTLLVYDSFAARCPLRSVLTFFSYLSEITRDGWRQPENRVSPFNKGGETVLGFLFKGIRWLTFCLPRSCVTPTLQVVISLPYLRGRRRLPSRTLVN